MSMDKLNYALCIAILTLCGATWISTNKITPPAHIYPRAIITLLFIFAVLLLLYTIFLLPEEKKRVKPFSQMRVKEVLISILLIGLYILGMQFIGFYVSSLVFMVVGIMFLEEQRTKKVFVKSLLIAFFTILVVYVAFNLFLGVPTPQNILI